MKYLILLTLIIIAFNGKAQKYQTPQEQFEKQKKEYLQQHKLIIPKSRIDSLPNYIKQIGQYKPQRLANPSHKLDSAIFTYASADTVMNELVKIIYSFDLNQQLIEFVVSTYDSSNTLSWEDTYRRTYTYNSAGQMTQWRQAFWSAYYNKWEPTDGEDFIFDVNDSLRRYIHYKWNNTLNYLDTNFKSDYYYDSQNHRYLEKNYYWDYVHQKWNLVGRTLQFYDSLSRLFRYENYSWYSSTSTWQAYKQFRYQYNSNGLLSQKIEASGFNSNNTWEDEFKRDYVYNSKSKIDTIFHYKNDSLITNWEFIYITVNTYDSTGNIIKTIKQAKDSLGNSFDFSRYFYQYNASNYLTLFWSESLSAITNNWEGWWKYRLYYDATNNVTSYWNYDYDTTNQTWDSLLLFTSEHDLSLNNQDIIIPRNDHLFYGSMNFVDFYPIMEQSNNALKHYSNYTEDWLNGTYYQETYYTFYYSAVDASIVGSSNENHIKIYPNPTSSLLNIDINSQNKESGIIEIYDIQGRIILTINTSSNEIIRIDVSRLKAGLYFLKYNSSQQSSINKFIIE